MNRISNKAFGVDFLTTSDRIDYASVRLKISPISLLRNENANDGYSGIITTSFPDDLLSCSCVIGPQISVGCQWKMLHIYMM